MPPPALSVEAAAAVAWLRSEVAGSAGKARQARLLGEVGEIEERNGDEAGAARDYLAAFNADPSFREPLEGLVRLLERRHSFRNLGKVIDAFVKSSKKPEEAGRALLMKSAFAADVAGDLSAARDAALYATKAATTGPEAALSWLTLEVIAGKLGDLALRREALEKRVSHTTDPTWKALLLLDLASLEAPDDPTLALKHAREAVSLGGGATFRALQKTARLVRRHPGEPGSAEADERSRLYAAALERQGDILRDAVKDAERGDAAGAPRWARTRAHVIDAWLRGAESYDAIAEHEAAASVLDRALSLLDEPDSTDASLFKPAILAARMRVAEHLGDTSLAARIAETRLASETNPGLASLLGVRVADEAIHRGDTDAALATLSRVLEQDPTNITTRTLALDLAAVTSEKGRLASELASFSEHIETPEARAQTLLVAALLTGAEGGDVAKAKELLKKAVAVLPNAGVPSAPGIAARIGRVIGAIRGDAALREEATRDLVGSGAEDREQAGLWFEVLRSSFTRGAVGDAEVSLQALAEAPLGAWLAATLEAFLPGRETDQAEALDALVALETTERAAALTLLAALRAQQAGDLDGARKRLRSLQTTAPDDVLVATYLADLEREAAPLLAADAAMRAAQVTHDPALAASLFLEAGLGKWRGGDLPGALVAFESARETDEDSARPLLRWAARGVDTDTHVGRLRAIARAEAAGEDRFSVALERFATELAAGEHERAGVALSDLRDAPEGALAVAGALAQIVAPPPTFTPEDAGVALRSVGGLGDVSAIASAAEAFRTLERAPASSREDLAAAAQTWLDVGGGMAAAFEWLAATSGTAAEPIARRALATYFDGDARDLILASAALLEARAGRGPGGWLTGAADAVHLANLELAPPGSDRERRARALLASDKALGGKGETLALRGWPLFAAGDTREALAAFQEAARAQPTDLSAWAGMHAAARATGNRLAQVEAASEIGRRCVDSRRGAEFLEEAGLLEIELSHVEEAEELLAAAFARDPSRTVAFDRLFRRVRERKDGEKLLDLIAKRLDFSDDPAEIVKLYWERSRVLREKGDVDGAMIALENVTMVEPDHVGALALSGEIYIRRGQFAEAAEALGRLAKIEEAPPKNRATAGIAAVDLYENKLDRTDLALEILIVLHKANLTNLAVRERLARAAAKAGSWTEAASILEELMLERPTSAGRVEAAQLAMAIRRDRLSDRAGATKAMVKLLEEAPSQGDAVDLLLDAPLPEDQRKRLLQAARAALLADVAAEPTRGPVVRRLARVAKALSDPSLEQSALAASVVVGSIDDTGRGALARLSQGKPGLPRIALTEALQRSIVAPGDDGPIAELFALLGPTLAEALGPTLAVMGVGKKERIDPRAGSAVRQEVAAWAGALGISEFELYVGGREPLGVQGVPGEPHSLVVGPDVRSPFPLATRARIARELYGILRGTNVLRLRDETTILAIVVAACREAEVPITAPAYAVQGEVDRLIHKAIVRKTRKALPEICQRIVQSKADARLWSQRAISTLDRIATVATGDVGVVLGDIIGQPPEKLADVVQGDRRAADLLRFALSDAYLDVRRTLGLEASS
jgi:tetratricopeptide (TPR) repeat protein